MSQSVSVSDIQEAIAVLRRWASDNGPCDPAPHPDLVRACADVCEQELCARGEENRR